MRNCNYCGSTNCKKMNSEWPKLRTKHNLPSTELSKFCTSFVPMKPLSSTLFEKALASNPDGLHQTLSNLKMRVVEKHYYPHFDIVSAYDRPKRNTKP